MKTMSQCIDKRMDIIEKLDKHKKYEPMPEELEDAYGYLNYCMDCGKRLRCGEPYTHCMFGNSHKFGCSTFVRICCYPYTYIKLIVMIPIAIIYLPIYGIMELIKYIKNKNEN